MKRISILVMALALVATLVKCKKTETPTNDNEGAKVHITLDVSSNSRVIISPETGGTAFEQGDAVLVANGGHYVGTLTYDQSQRKFDGDLDEGLSTADYLHFYLLGNKDTEENLNDATNRPTTLTVNISDQTASYPEIAYAPSTVKYTEGVTAYKARLLNKCALVKFTTNSIPTSVPVTITGMNNKVSVNLGSNSFTYSKVGDGIISLHAESKTARWGILLPQGEVDDVVASAEGYVTTPAFTVPQHGENDYLNEGIALALVESYPVGAINGKYTINADGGQVYFSKGNLQYQASTNTWRFAERQIDYVGLALNGNVYEGGVQCDNALMSSTYSGWIDLFGWGTSGYNHGAVCYYPWSTDRSDGNYLAYGLAGCNLYDQTGKADWGYNAISNGGNEENSGWRTLTNSEMDYVLNTRVTASGIRWAKGTVNGVNGVILFPDDWSTTIYSMNVVNGGNYSSNIINADDWAALLEPNGVVFLPYTGGIRRGTGNAEVGTGAYLLSTWYSNGYVWNYGFNNNNVVLSYMAWPSDGRAVRLARNVQ